MAIYSPDQNVYSFFKPTIDVSQNMFFQRNNLLYPQLSNITVNPYLHQLYSKGIAIWLSSEGEVCYRTHFSSNIHTTSLRNTNIVLSKILGSTIKIVTKRKKSSEVTPMNLQINVSEISIHEFLLVEGEKFEPFQPLEFFPHDYQLLSYYRNTFSPSCYLLNNPTQNHELHYSITIQYIYYLAKYNRERFYFIMNWLAAFFKNLPNRSKIALVFVGNKESGKEILFDAIIKPLFGQEYCLKITDNVLETTSVQKLLKNKLFYNIDNLSNSVLKDKKAKKIINDLLSKDAIELIENKETISEYPKYGQTIITIDEAYLPYIDKDFESYSIFNVQSNIEQMYIPDELMPKQTTIEESIYSKPNFDHNITYDDFGLDEFQTYKTHQNTRKNISKSDLTNMIRQDLENFASILKGYKIDLDKINSPFVHDDKNYLQNNFQDKLKTFHEAILNHKTLINYFRKIQEKDDSLYGDLISDFKLNRIKQKNLIKYFSILHPEETITSSRTLMVQLRKVDKSFYNEENIKGGTAGIKYFRFS